MTKYRVFVLRVHPRTLRAKGFGRLEPADKFIVGKPGDCARFDSLTGATVYHAIVTGSSADLYGVKVDPTAPMKSGRCECIGWLTADGDKEGSARGSQILTDRLR